MLFYYNDKAEPGKEYGFRGIRRTLELNATASVHDSHLHPLRTDASPVFRVKVVTQDAQWYLSVHNWEEGRPFLEQRPDHTCPGSFACPLRGVNGGRGTQKKRAESSSCGAARPAPPVGASFKFLQHGFSLFCSCPGLVTPSAL